MTALPDSLRPVALASRPLYAPLAELLQASGERLPALMPLNRLIRSARPDLANARGVTIDFVAPGASAMRYEQAVSETGQVETRPENWHDYFNALVWAAFPQAKAALNQRHLHEIGRGDGGARRGPVRDALTQFDECGLVVLGAAAPLLEGLAHHAWREVFWASRAALLAHTRFILFGHASYDQLREPFPGLCAKALYLQVPEALVRAPVVEQVVAVDAWLAGRLGDPHQALSTADFSPLPLLGIPGVVHDNTRQDYYADTRQFRPLGGRPAAIIHRWQDEAALAL